MHFSSVLAVVAVLVVSVSAVPLGTEQAVTCYAKMFCIRKSDCTGCGTCVSMGSLRPGFNHMTHWRGRSTFIAQLSVVAVGSVSVFSTSAVWLMTWRVKPR
ncbi:hypothetical protein EDB19DRAFT_1705517 [Suillus lakei]|nr:hypothetical protein EDB19DRAFT_1705517 [Suillus lakei]